MLVYPSMLSCYKQQVVAAVTLLLQFYFCNFVDEKEKRELVNESGPTDIVTPCIPAAPPSQPSFEAQTTYSSSDLDPGSAFQAPPLPPGSSPVSRSLLLRVISLRRRVTS